MLGAVEEWGKERGMEAIVGPLGFTDMDAEGMLVEGFDQLGTMSTIYNYPYYQQHMERLGFEKEADWVEFKLTVPDKLPEKFIRISEIILEKYKLKIKKLKRSEIKSKNYGQKIFDLINEAYAPLYGYSQMTQGQINQYIKMYLPLIDLRMVSLVEDENENLVAVGISMPSLSEALQKELDERYSVAKKLSEDVEKELDKKYQPSIPVLETAPEEPGNDALWVDKKNLRLKLWDGENWRTVGYEPEDPKEPEKPVEPEEPDNTGQGGGESDGSKEEPDSGNTDTGSTRDGSDNSETSQDLSGD